MKRGGAFCFLSCSQLILIIGVLVAFWSLGAGASSPAAATLGDEGSRSLTTVNGSGSVHCVDCGYTPDSPAPMSPDDVPRCSDVVCLVQGLLDRKSLIYIDQDIDISGTGVLPDITSKITIMGTCSEGLPCKIDARGKTRVFVIGLDGHLTLKDLEITGALCERGSAVTVSGSGSNDTTKAGKFAALNVLFSNNTATELGGALHVESGGLLFLRDCIFRSNQAPKGGAIYVGSAKDFPGKLPESSAHSEPVICALSSCTTFQGVEFVKNFATTGGAVYVDDALPDCVANGGAKFDCTACVFHKNVAQRDGGAVFLNYHSSGAISYFRKSKFTENSAGYYGGDISTQKGDYGSRGAQIYADEVLFNGSKAGVGSSVAVKQFSFSTFSRCRFPLESALSCEGSCDTFCPSPTPLSNSSLTYGPEGESCPMAPPPLCNWFPADCQAPPPPGVPTPPPPPPLLPLPPALAPGPAEQAFPPPSTPSVRGRHARNTPLAPPGAPEGEAPGPVEAPGPALAPAPGPSLSGAGARRRNNNGSITGDPHFVGKHGERFDFHGSDGRDYCIFSDRDLNINMHVFRAFHRRTTFISKIGMLLRDDKVLVDAQANKHAPNFEDQWRLFVNGIELPKERTTETPSGLKITHLSGAVQIRLFNELDLNVTVRPPGFGKYGSGLNYLDFQINKVKVSLKVHGVLGQTYQENSATYHKMYVARFRGLKRSRAAALLMDGSEDDYLSSAILAPDCKYSAYTDRSRVSKRVQRIVLEGAKSLLGFREQQQVVRQCTGFGHSLCFQEVEA